MIEFPDTPAPNGVNPTLLDFGFVQRPASGAAILRIDKPGSRYRAEVSYPPMPADTARHFIARAIKAKRDGLKIEYPLLGVSQGAPGSPVVNGAGQTGTSLTVRGLTSTHVVREGYWLTIIDAAGQGYLHSVQAQAVATSGGLATLTIEPALRVPFADGATILLAKPTIEGFIEDVSWSLSIDKLVRFGGSIVIEEAA